MVHDAPDVHDVVIPMSHNVSEFLKGVAIVVVHVVVVVVDRDHLCRGGRGVG